MNNTEQLALQRCHTSIIESLDVKYVLPHLYEREKITREELLNLRDVTIASQSAENLIFIVTERCTFQAFLDILSVSGYEFLKDRVLKTYDEIDKNTTELPQPVRRVSVHNQKWRSQTSFIAHELTRLVHNNEIEKFLSYRDKLVNRWEQNKHSSLAISTKQQYADQALVALDTEIAMKRIQYNGNLDKDDVFKSMKNLIPYTSDPIVTSMTYLARYSSALTIKKPLENGLDHIQYAKSHSEGVSPCRESGMVFYIEFNMLAQKYEKDGPSQGLKSDLIKTAKAAIGHFNAESIHAIGADFRRMLLLKIANVHLGIGAFGNNIEAAEVSTEDIRSAKKILDELEQPEMWSRMEKRRKMFYHIAKNRLYYHREQYDLAQSAAESAKILAVNGNFSRELPHIEELLVHNHHTVPNISLNVHELDTLMEQIDNNDAQFN